MVEYLSQPSSIVLEIANARARIPMEQDIGDIDWEISNDKSEAPGESTLSSDIEEDNFDILQEAIHLDQAQHDKSI
jgi:hypothetical protein